MNVDSAFGLTPAAIISEANECRHSCKPIGSSPAATQARWARRPGTSGVEWDRRAAAEHESALATEPHLVLQQLVAQGGCDWNHPSTRA